MNFVWRWVAADDNLSDILAKSIDFVSFRHCPKTEVHKRLLMSVGGPFHRRGPEQMGFKLAFSDAGISRNVQVFFF